MIDDRWRLEYGRATVVAVIDGVGPRTFKEVARDVEFKRCKRILREVLR